MNQRIKIRVDDLISIISARQVEFWKKEEARKQQEAKLQEENDAINKANREKVYDKLQKVLANLTPENMPEPAQNPYYGHTNEASVTFNLKGIKLKPSKTGRSPIKPLWFGKTHEQTNEDFESDIRTLELHADDFIWVGVKSEYQKYLD